MNCKQILFGVILLLTMSRVRANTPEICADVKTATDEMENYLQNQSIGVSVGGSDKKRKDLEADYDKVAAKLTVLRGIIALRSRYDQHLHQLMLQKGLDPEQTERSLKDFLITGDKLIGLNGIIRKQRELGKPIEGESLALSFGHYCEDPQSAELQGLSVICHSLSATNHFNVKTNITVEPDQAQQFFERFLHENNKAWERMDPSQGDNLRYFNDFMFEALNRGTKDVKVVLDDPDKFSLAVEKETLRDASKLYKKFGDYAACVRSKQKNCESLDPRQDDSYEKFVRKVEDGLSDPEGGKKSLAKYKPFIFAELERKFGSLDRMSEIINKGVNQEALLQIAHPVLNDIYRSLELAYRKNGPQSFKNNPNLAQELPKKIQELRVEVEGLGICGELITSMSTRDNSDKGLATCINGLNSEVLGNVSAYIAKLEEELKSKKEDMAAFMNQPGYKEVSEMKYQLLGFLVTNCSNTFKQKQAYCNAETDLKSAFSEVRFLEGDASNILIELDRSLDTKVYSINRINDYCKRERKYPLPSVDAICTGITGQKIAVTNQAPIVLSNSGAKMYRPPQVNYRAQKQEELARSAKAFKELSADEYVEFEDGRMTFKKKNTMNDNLSFAIQQNQGRIGEVVGLYFYGKDDGMLDLQLQQMKMQHQARLQYDYNMNSIKEQTAQYQSDYYKWLDKQFNSGAAFNGWSYGYAGTGSSDGYQQYLQNRTGTVNVENSGYNFNN
jgi:hypothetical protein